LYKTILKTEEYKKGNLSTDFLKRYGIIDKLTQDIKEDQKLKQDAAIAGAIMYSEFFRSKVKSSSVPSHRWKSHMDRR
ncbi:MAG: acetyl-CoA carboxylase biotin carboxylase subunit, partial [Candidatus Nitrosotenuis sp.]